MNIRARVANGGGQHEAAVQTDGRMQRIEIPPKESGAGSSANGGELLFLALATCYCNDIYREAAKRGITVERVEVDVEGTFGAAGEPGRDITYRARVAAHASEEAIRELMEATDKVAEIQNTLRGGAAVTLTAVEVESV